jgi:RimJ/RimL family protein N-acetyltransferase
MTPLPEVLLREVEAADLPVFFEHQQDAVARSMAAFTSEDPTDHDAFVAFWDRLMADDAITKRTILVDGLVAGQVMSFEMFGELEVTYWIGREFWGRGVATTALRILLDVVTVRPLHARVAKDNAGSLRVLEKCGFVVTGEDRGFANAHGEEVAEYVLILDATASE